MLQAHGFAAHQANPFAAGDFGDQRMTAGFQAECSQPILRGQRRGIAVNLCTAVDEPVIAFKSPVRRRGGHNLQEFQEPFRAAKFEQRLGSLFAWFQLVGGTRAADPVDPLELRLYGSRQRVFGNLGQRLNPTLRKRMFNQLSFLP